MNPTYFKLYKDLIVRQSIKQENHLTDVDQIAVIEFDQYLSYYPSFFTNSKHFGKVIYLRKYSPKEEVPLNEYFSLIEFKEVPDPRENRNYYKKIEIVVKDRLEDIFIFTSKTDDNFYFKKPVHDLTYKDFEKYFKVIVDELKDVKSFEAYFMKNNIKK